MNTLRIGSRESRLAVIQSELVAEYLRTRGVEAPLVTMKTTGDLILDRSLDQVGGKGLFVKELDRALREGRSDLSVHSCKDLPMQVPDDLPIVGYSRREDPRDVLVLPAGETAWDRGRPVGCSSRRRMLQLAALEPGLTFQGVRGNVLTRLAKLDRGEYGALVLAAAGLKRLGLEHRISRYFEPEELIPAAGQGILCLQGRRGVDYAVLDGFLDREAELCARAERAFVRELDGGCSSPIAAFARLAGEELTLLGLHWRAETDAWRTGRMTGPADDPEGLGRALAGRLKRELEGATV